MFIILIIIAIMIFALLWIFNIISYKKNYSIGINKLNATVVESFNVLHSNFFPLLPGYSNFTFSLMRKCVLAVIAILLSALLNWYWVSYIFSPFVIISWMVFSARLKAYRISDESKRALTPIFVACAFLPIYDSLLFLLIVIARFF